MSFFKRKHKEEMYKYDEDEEELYDDNHSLPKNGAAITPKQFNTLFWLNLAAFVFQAASCAGIFVLIDEEKTYPFYTNYPLASPPEDEGRPVFGPDSKVSFNLNVGYLSGTFLLLSAVDHLAVCTVFKGYYEKGLSKNYNIFRWIEYSLSASLMRVLVGILSGLTDLHMQFLLFGLTACTMLFGLVFELENSEKRLKEGVKWYTFWLGFIPHFFSWAVVIGYFFYALSTGDPPAFVYAIIFIVFFLDLSFAIVLGIQWKGGCCCLPYVNGEIAFIILSFTSKNLLAWINFFGGNR
jgi:hypothetical protein